MSFSVDEIAKLVALVTAERLDSLEVGEVKIKKSLHEGLKEDKPMNFPKLSEEELLYGAGAQALSVEEQLAFVKHPRGKKAGE